MYLVYIYMFCFVIVYQTICIQIAHVTKQKYKPWRGLYLGVIVPMLVVIAVDKFFSFKIKFWFVVLVLTTKIAFYLSFFLYFVINEITEILDIEVFVTKQERLKRDSQ